MPDPSDGKEPYPNAAEGGWPDDDEEIPVDADATMENWKVPYPEDKD